MVISTVIKPVLVLRYGYFILSRHCYVILEAFNRIVIIHYNESYPTVTPSQELGSSKFCTSSHLSPYPKPTRSRNKKNGQRLALASMRKLPLAL